MNKELNETVLLASFWYIYGKLPTIVIKTRYIRLVEYK